MSSSKNPVSKSSEAATSAQPESDTQDTVHPEPERTVENTMDHHPASTLITDDSSSTPTPEMPPEPSPAEALASATASVDAVAPDPTDERIRLHPIPPASEPMQYRAIGLVKGKYKPSDEQFTRGMFYTEEGVEVDAVLLGRVMSLVKKHLDLEQPHLWVVYPRTRSKDGVLHFQIVGVWEPEKLNRSLLQSEDEASEDDDDLDADNLDPDDLDIDGLGTDDLNPDNLDDETAIQDETDDESDQGSEATVDAETQDEVSDDQPVEAAATLAQAPTLPTLASKPALPTAVAESKPVDSGFPDLQDGYFSIRGEIIFDAPEESYFIVRIQQAPRKNIKKTKAFQLKVRGVLNGKSVGYFWDLNVQRRENFLEIQSGTMIAMVPPKPKKASGGKRWGPGGGGPRRKFGGSNMSGPPKKRSPYPSKPQAQPAGSGDRAPTPRRPTPKPIRRSRDESSNSNPNPG